VAWTHVRLLEVQLPDTIRGARVRRADRRAAAHFCAAGGQRAGRCVRGAVRLLHRMIARRQVHRARRQGGHQRCLTPVGCVMGLRQRAARAPDVQLRAAAVRAGVEPRLAALVRAGREQVAGDGWLPAPSRMQWLHKAQAQVTGTPPPRHALLPLLIMPTVSQPANVPVVITKKHAIWY